MDIALLLGKAHKDMEVCLDHFQKDLKKLRVGSIDLQRVQNLIIDHHGVPVRLKEVASVSAENQRTLVIKPWGKKVLTIIERALQHQKANFSVHNNGELLRLLAHPPTQERRKAMVKQLDLMEEAVKVKLRAIRQSYRQELKTHQVEDERKSGEQALQKTADKQLKGLQAIVQQKAAALMQV